MSDEPDLVSVIIPTRNRPQYVWTAVRSVLEQTYRNLEVVVIDDGSNPPVSFDTQDQRVTLARNANPRGGPAARNRGLQLARGDYLCCLDDDDVYYPDKIKRQLDYLKMHPDVDMVFSQLRRDDRQGGITISPPDDYRFHPLTNFRFPNKIHNNSTLFRRRVLEKVRFDERLTKYQDWQFNMAISLQFKVEYLPIRVGVWHRDKRPDRLALQDERAKFRNFRIICEIFADVINGDADLRQRYYRRLGYLALKTNHWQCARSSFNKINTWRRWPAFAGAILRHGGSAISANARRCYASLHGASHA